MSGNKLQKRISFRKIMVDIYEKGKPRDIMCIRNVLQFFCEEIEVKCCCTQATSKIKRLQLHHGKQIFEQFFFYFGNLIQF